jgi:hypothetical protein
MPLDTYSRLGQPAWRALPWRYCSGNAVVVTASTAAEAVEIETWACLISDAPRTRPLQDGGPIRRW